MERIQLVAERLREIESDYYTFFKNTNSGIYDYLIVKSNNDGNWVNVTIKDNPKLLPEINTIINDTFINR
ncbi:MAG TPA: hypothetical protein VGM63_04150 [Mucilaginibacter sp.]|jgi:hypothetical protein